MLGFNPFNGDDLIDICSGTGGFLLAAFNHLREIIKKDYNGDEKLLAEIASKSLKGQEIDSEVANLANNTLTVRTGLYSSELDKNCPVVNKYSLSFETKLPDCELPLLA